MTEATPWTVAQVAGIADQRGPALPVIGAADVAPMLPGHDLWDMWPLARADGGTVRHRGRAIWFFLAAPQLGDPDLRHDHARIRTLLRGSDGWTDLGPTFPDGLTPGSREWSGSAVLEDDGRRVTHYFTAAGRRGAATSFEQRLFEVGGHADMDGAVPRLGGWGTPVESLVADGRWYLRADQAAAVDGRIKGFRDPSYFRDPADGAEYLTFTGSSALVDAVDDGVVGLAARAGGRWVAQAPLVDATGVNGELERAHIVAHAGRYYLFWSTQASRFSAAAAAGVTGLYGMVADRVGGPYRPLNGTGLVAANPAAEPTQAYCWWVTGELEVASFVDLWGTGGRPPVGDARRTRFGGTAAPFFRLALDGDRAAILPTTG